MFGVLGEVAELVAEPLPETTAKRLTGMFGVLGEVAELVAEPFPETTAKRLRTDISSESFLPSIFRFDLRWQKTKEIINILWFSVLSQIIKKIYQINTPVNHGKEILCCATFTWWKKNAIILGFGFVCQRGHSWITWCGLWNRNSETYSNSKCLNFTQNGS